MRKLLALLLCAQFGSVFAANSILAIVNDNIITMASLEQQLSTVNSFDEKMAVIDQQIDNLLIQEKIVKLGITPTQQSIDAAVVQIAQNNNMTNEQLRAHPQFPTFLQQIISQLAVSTLQQSVIQGMTINLTDEEIKVNCHSNAAKNNTRQIRVAQIIITELADVDNQEVAVKELLNKLAMHVKKGASFYDFAKLHSQDPSYAQGGLSDWITIEGENLAFFDKLKEGEVSDIYNSNSGWAIAIKADERYIDSNLEACKQQMINSKATQHYLDWVEELRSSAYIEIYSDKL
ncbi:MAG: peptidylprolyl isomerase [Gammaproteobacteria bacterium]